MSCFSSFDCCEEKDIDVALDVISENKLRICCLNCEREVCIDIGKIQYELLSKYRKNEKR